MFNLEQAMKAIEGRKDFEAKSRDGHVIIDYGLTLPDSFDCPIRQNLRGTIFNEKTGEIVSLPLHKFFNVDQKPETSLELIKLQRAYPFEKMDGSMIHVLEVDDKIVCASRGGFHTDWAILATKLLEECPAFEQISKDVRSGSTVLFEFVGPNNPIVVPYSKMELVYLWHRNRNDGKYSYTPYSLMRSTENQVNSLTYLEELYEETKKLEDTEGVVAVLENGLWVKIKTDWYMKRHGAVGLLMKPMYHICELALNGKIDDLISTCPVQFKDKLIELWKEVTDDQIKLTDELMAEYVEIHQKLGVKVNCSPISGDNLKELRKNFAIEAKTNYKNHFGLLMDKFLNWYLFKEGSSSKTEFLMNTYQKTHNKRLFEINDYVELLNG